MVVVEDTPGFDRIEPIFGRHGPGHVENPVDIGPQHLVFRRCRSHASQPIDFAQRGGRDRFRKLRVFHPLSQLGDLVAFAFAQLLLDRLQLLAQVVPTLRVGHFLLRLRFDLAFELQQLDLARQRVRDRLQLLDEIVLLEHRLLFGRLHVEERGQHVREAERVVDVHHDRPQLLRQAGGQRQRLFDQFLDTADVRLHLDGALVRFRERGDLRPHRRADAAHNVGPHPGNPLDDDVDAAAGLGHLADNGDGADLAHVLRRRIVRIVFLEQQEDQSIHPERAVHRLNRNRPVDGQRLQRQGKRHRAAERKNRQFLGESWRGRLSHRGNLSLS